MKSLSNPRYQGSSRAAAIIAVANIISVTLLTMTMNLPLLRNPTIVYRTLILGRAHRLNFCFQRPGGELEGRCESRRFPIWPSKRM